MEQIFDLSESYNSDSEVDIIELVGMKLGDEEYAIDVLKIQEIIKTVEITVVPRLDDYVLGVMNLRGKVIPVMDLRVKFNLSSHDFDQTTRIIVVRFDRSNIGFVVDEVTAVIRVTKEMIEPAPPLVGSVGQEYILGICRYDERLVMILDIDRVLKDGNNMGDSDLRKIMLGNKGNKAKGSTKGKASEPVIGADKKSSNGSDTKPKAVQDISQTSETATVQSSSQQSSASAPEEADVVADLDIDQAIIEELKKRELETDQLNKEKKSTPVVAPSLPVDDTESASIDDLIAAELLAREQETDALNVKRRGGSVEDVLADAVSQSGIEEMVHVSQDELDSLISKELNMREKETEELNKKKRQDLEKKN